MSGVVVVGAGLGGLAAAVTLAAAGRSVEVVEAAGVAGGKVGTVEVDGVAVDTGPSVLTLPEVLGELLALAGMRLGVDVVLRRPSPAFRYVWPDGAVVDVFVEREATLESVGRSLGAAAREELAAFLAYAERIWAVADPAFVRGGPPGWGTLWSRPAPEWPRLLDIDPLRTMDGAIRGRVRDPHLRMLLQRYATYNGSDVRRAPATLNCIAHVELGLGGFGVEGGVARVAEALVEAGRRLGVRYRFGAAVETVGVEGGRVTGVRLGGGEGIPADAVVWNGEVARLAAAALPPALRRPSAHLRPDSTSGWTAVVRARRRAVPRVAHTVLFPVDYVAEFVDLFDRERVPEDPTVYLCAQEAGHGRRGWADHEPVFLMVNAPPEADGAGPMDADRLVGRVRARLESADLLVAEDTIVWSRTPAGLAARFPGSRGALYGRASNGPLAAFARPSPRFAGVPGLYLAGGSVHPGGGMPLAMLSGRAAAAALLADAGLRLPASMDASP